MPCERVNVRRASGFRRGVHVIPALPPSPAFGLAEDPARELAWWPGVVANGQRGEAASSHQLRRNALLDLLPSRRIEGLDVGMAVEIEEPGRDRQLFTVERGVRRRVLVH